MKLLFRFFLTFALATAVAACSDDTPDETLRVNGGKSFLSLDAQPRSGQISVWAPSPWQITTAPGDDWFTLSATSGGAGSSLVDVTFSRNEGAARSAVLTFVCGGAELPFTLSQTAAATGFDTPTYYFYAAFGTMPALYSGLHLLSHDYPSYFFYERPKTFDPAEFPAYAVPLTAADRDNPITEDEIHDAVEKIKERILEINAGDPTAVFGLYTNELTCRVGYDWFVAQGIDSARVKVTMLTDGTASYNNFYNFFGDPATAETAWNEYAAQVEELDWNHGGRYPVTRAPSVYLSERWTYYMATLPDYRLLLQNKSLLEVTSPFMQARLEQMHIESVQPYELLHALPETARQQFYRMAEFDYARFEALFDASPRKNLIIIGTSHSTEQSAQQQAAYTKRIMEQYGAQYDIFFKPHPADISSADYPERFPGLTLLPGQMPFEIFVWSLLDKVDLIGGYPSTVFMSVPVNKVGFLFAPDAASLVRPLNVLFRDATDIEWMQ